MYVEQTTFPLVGSMWNPGAADLTGYTAPASRFNTPSVMRDVTVIGTVRNEAVALERSLHWWVRQAQPDGWSVTLLVLDDGSDDHPEQVVDAYRDQVPFWMRLRFVRLRGPGGPDRSCTLAFNIAFRQLVQSPFVLVQWWDRIPGHPDLLRLVLAPHQARRGIVTSGVSRHVGGSSSMDGMDPAALAAVLDMVPWRDDALALARVAGPIGGHCVPGQMTESSFWCTTMDEVEALGGYDERYTTRAGYANVELWRRMLQVGLAGVVVAEPWGANYHQSHRANRDKDAGWLHDLRARRNQGLDWGAGRPEEAL
jgi:hypothetical protein